MNRNLYLTAGLLLVSTLAIAQAQPTPSNDVRGAAGGAASQTNQTTDKVLNKQAGQNKQGEAQQAPATPAAPSGGTKVAPEPKTKEEAAAMKEVIAKANDPAAMQAAADDFSAKFPESNVRGMLYRQLMLVYEQQGNADKGYEAGRKALSYDPDDPLTLADCSFYLASHTHDSDLDKDERLAEAKKMANDAITNIDQLRLNAQASAVDRDKYKKAVLSQAYSSLAVASQATKDWAGAETNYSKAIELNPDPATILRLGFAQRMQNKLEPALASFNRAIETGKAANADVVVQIATQQKDSVEKQLAKQKGAAPAATPAAAPTTPKQ